MVKFYLVKYFFIINAVLQAMAMLLYYVQFPDTPKTRAVVFIIFSISLFFFSLHVLVAHQIRWVVLGKKKIGVKYGKRIKNYDWKDVNKIKPVPFIRMYKMLIKNKLSFYFIPPAKADIPADQFSVDYPDTLKKKLDKK